MERDLDLDLIDGSVCIACFDVHDREFIFLKFPFVVGVENINARDGSLVIGEDTVEEMNQDILVFFGTKDGFENAVYGRVNVKYH